MIYLLYTTVTLFFTLGNIDETPIVILSYDECSDYSNLLLEGYVDLLICARGDLLNDSNTDNYEILKEFNASRRIVVSGLENQNKLSRLFRMVDLACPDFLGSYNQFKKKFIKPMEEGSKPNASADKQRLKEERAKELDGLLRKCLIRRTKSEIENENSSSE